jgi:hypothetical protein
MKQLSLIIVGILLVSVVGFLGNTCALPLGHQLTVTSSPVSTLGGTFNVNYTQGGIPYTNVQNTTPWTAWVDFNSPDAVSNPQSPINVAPGMRYVFTGYTSSGVTRSLTITLNYKIQYQVTFRETGVGWNFGDNIVTIDGKGFGESYDRVPAANLPTSFWWDNNSTHSFSFQGWLEGTLSTSHGNYAGNYIWKSTTGLSASQSDSLNVTGSGSVTGNYFWAYDIVPIRLLPPIWRLLSLIYPV